MLTISKSLSAGQARTYHSREFTSEKQNYWSRDQQAHSEWQGKLAQEWGLQGEVGSEHFARLSEGQHPESGVQLVKHQPARTYENEYRKQITSVGHRAGWDATFSAPKSVSLTALVGGEERVRQAHRDGRVHEIKGREERISANRSRTEINQTIHTELQSRGVVSREEHSVQTLVPRQEITSAA